MLLLLLVSSIVLFVFRTASGAEWSDWDKRQSCQPTVILRPNSVQDIREALASYANVKCIGAGHSFSPVALTDDAADRSNTSALLSLEDRFNRVLSLPSEEDRTVLVEAGIRLKDLNEALHEAGYALENLGAIAMQSVAGAIATSTHGTGSHLGSISTQVVDMDILLANGTHVTVNETNDKDLFDAARVGIGALGVVLRVRLRVVPAFKLRRTAMPYDLSQLLDDLPALKMQYPRLQFYFTPYTDVATLLLREEVSIDTPIDPCWPGEVGESSEDGKNVTCVDWSFKALCHEADDATLYTEMEYFVQVEHESEVMQRFLSYQDKVQNVSKCARSDSNCSLFTGVRYVKNDDIWLSPMYQRDIAVFSMIVLGTPDISGPKSEVELFSRDGLEPIATSVGGRPHWGKMHWATHADLERVYPRLADFEALRMSLDPPPSKFSNAYLRRTLIGLK